MALVLGASLIAHGHSVGPAPIAKGVTSVTLSRSLSCVSDAPGAAQRIGTVPAGTTGYSTASGQPGRVTFQPAVADKGYATQWAAGHGWLAARACPEPADDWWFVGVGAGISHRSYLTLDNPRTSDANVTITVYGPQGQVQAPGLNNLLVPAGQSLRLDLESVAPALGDLAVHVNVVRGLVAASTWETWALSPVTPTVSSWVPPAPALATRVQVVGVPANLTAATLMVTNPNVSSVVVNLRVTTGSATFTPASHPSVTVPPGSTKPVDLTDLLKLGIGAVTVTSPSAASPITAGLRVVRGNTETYATTGLHIGAQSTAGLPDGFPASVLLTSLTAASMDLTAIDSKGAVLLTKNLAVPAAGLMSVSLPPGTAALALVGPADAGVSGSVIIDNGSMALIGLSPTATAAIVPPVVQQPY